MKFLKGLVEVLEKPCWYVWIKKENEKSMNWKKKKKINKGIQFCYTTMGRRNKSAGECWWLPFDGLYIFCIIKYLYQSSMTFFITDFNLLFPPIWNLEVANAYLTDCIRGKKNNKTLHSPGLLVYQIHATSTTDSFFFSFVWYKTATVEQTFIKANDLMTWDQ